MVTADPNARLQEFTDGCLAALTDEQFAECQLLAGLESGVRLRTSGDDPGHVELLWGGAVIGLTTWAWLGGV